MTLKTTTMPSRTYRPAWVRGLGTLALFFLLGHGSTVEAQLTGPGFHYGVRAGVNHVPSIGRGAFTYGAHAGLVGQYRFRSGPAVSLNADYGTLSDLRSEFVFQQYIVLPNRSFFTVDVVSLTGVRTLDLSLYVENYRWQWKGFSLGLGLRHSRTIDATGLSSEYLLELRANQMPPTIVSVQDLEQLAVTRRTPRSTFGSFVRQGILSTWAVVPRVVKRLPSGQVIYLDVAYEFVSRYPSLSNLLTINGGAVVLQLGFQYLLK